MSKDEQIAAIKELIKEIGGKFKSSYSGKYMKGKRCIGVETSDPEYFCDEAAKRGIVGGRWDRDGNKCTVYFQKLSLD